MKSHHFGRDRRSLPDGRVLALYEKEKFLDTLSAFDRVMIETDSPVFLPLSVLWSEDVEFGVTGVRLHGTEIELSSLRRIFRALYLDKSNIFEQAKKTYTEYCPPDGWWLDVPDQCCVPRPSSENGQAKILYSYLRAVYSRPRVGAIRVLIVGSSSGERGGISVISLASILSITNPGSTITAYDPFELSSEFEYNATKICRVRGVYPRGEWRWYDVILDDSYLIHVSRADPWLPIPEGRSLMSKAFSGSSQPYYVGSEHRFYSDRMASESLIYVPGFACNCRDCKFVRPLADIIPVDPSFIAAAFLRTGIHPCSPIPLAKTYIAQGEIIATLYSGNLFDCDTVSSNVKRYYRAASMLAASGFGELSGTNMVLPRYSPPTGSVRKFSVRGFSRSSYSRPKFLFDDVAAIFQGIPVNYGPYAASVSAPSVPGSQALVMVVDDYRTLDYPTPVILSANLDPPRGYTSSAIECRISNTVLRVYGRDAHSPHGDAACPSAVLSSHLSAVLGVSVAVRSGSAPPSLRSLDVVRTALVQLKIDIAYDKLSVKSKYYEDRGFVLPWNVYRPKRRKRAAVVDGRSSPPIRNPALAPARSVIPCRTSVSVWKEKRKKREVEEKEGSAPSSVRRCSHLSHSGPPVTSDKQEVRQDDEIT